MVFVYFLLCITFELLPQYKCVWRKSKLGTCAYSDVMHKNVRASRTRKDYPVVVFLSRKDVSDRTFVRASKRIDLSCWIGWKVPDLNERVAPATDEAAGPAVKIHTRNRIFRNLNSELLSDHVRLLSLRAIMFEVRAEVVSKIGFLFL